MIQFRENCQELLIDFAEFFNRFVDISIAVRSPSFPALSLQYSPAWSSVNQQDLTIRKGIAEKYDNFDEISFIFCNETSKEATSNGFSVPSYIL